MKGIVLAFAMLFAAAMPAFADSACSAEHPSPEQVIQDVKTQFPDVLVFRLRDVAALNATQILSKNVDADAIADVDQWVIFIMEGAPAARVVGFKDGCFDGTGLVRVETAKAMVGQTS